MSDVAPLELGELSRLGFGGYRIVNGDPQHEQALADALAAGCTLVDTASSYSDGGSEELIGHVLERTGARAFVITKAGYVSPATAAELHRAGIDVDRLGRLQSGTAFSLDVPVLQATLELSRRRLRRRVLDTVLLHNPERLLETGAGPDTLQESLCRAFELFEDEIEAGRLRYYGVSSNALPAAAPGEALDADSILACAPSGSDRLAFLQFPLNLLERRAADGDGSRPGLIERLGGRARTLTNRPLNAIRDGRPARLALPCDELPIDPWESCVRAVRGRLEAVGEAESWDRFAPMQFLRDQRDDLADPELVDVLWSARIEPFLDTLFGDSLPEDAAAAFDALHERMRASARARLAEGTLDLVPELEQEGILEPGRDELLPVAACRWCLEQGADHVLVGMRRPRYVAELAPLIRAELAGSRLLPPAT